MTVAGYRPFKVLSFCDKVHAILHPKALPLKATGQRLHNIYVHRTAGFYVLLHYGQSYVICTRKAEPV